MTRGEHPGIATLFDVAREAGVSRATAARALGGYGSVSPEARERVAAAAQRLRYRPNIVARSMKSGTTGTMGVIVADIQLAFFAQAVRGITDAANAEGVEVILANTDEDLAKERAAVGVLVDKRVDGLLVAPADPGETAHLQDAQERGIPVVLIDRVASGMKCDAFVVDNQRAARNATDHLLRLGHRRIAIVMETSSARGAADLVASRSRTMTGFTSTLREIGWASALRSAGVPVTDDLIRRARYERDDARATTLAALRGPDRPTALLATDETMTLGAIDAIREAGLVMPYDVSLVGFDDSPWTTIVEPQVSVVAQPVHELGLTAARRLLERMAGFDGAADTVVLRTSFLHRGSTAPLADPGT